MSMYECPYCWNVVCVCGHKYKDWSIDDLQKRIEMLQKLLDDKFKKWESRKCLITVTDGK